MTTQWRPIEELDPEQVVADAEAADSDAIVLLADAYGDASLVRLIPQQRNGVPGFEAVSTGLADYEDAEPEVELESAVAWMELPDLPSLKGWPCFDQVHQQSLEEARRAADAEKPEDFEGAFAAFEQERQEKAALMASGAPEPDASRPIDPVERPAHYCQGAIETIDYIESLGIGEAFCQGNAIKYLSRYRLKGGVEDLRKARWYVDRLITLQLERKP